MRDDLGLVVEIRDEERFLLGDEANTLTSNKTNLQDLLLSHLVEIDLNIAIVTILNSEPAHRLLSSTTARPSASSISVNPLALNSNLVTLR